MNVGKVPQTPEHDIGFFLCGKFYGQALVTLNRHLRHIGDEFGDHIYPFGGREKLVFGRILADGDDQFVEKLNAPADNVQMPLGYRVERAGKNRSYMFVFHLHLFNVRCPGLCR